MVKNLGLAGVIGLIFAAIVITIIVLVVIFAKPKTPEDYAKRHDFSHCELRTANSYKVSRQGDKIVCKSPYTMEGRCRDTLGNRKICDVVAGQSDIPIFGIIAGLTGQTKYMCCKK